MWCFLHLYYRIFMWISISSKQKKKRFPLVGEISVAPETCIKNYSDAAGPGRMQNTTALPKRWKRKVCLGSCIGGAEFFWRCYYLFLSVYCVARVSLRSQCVVLITCKIKTGPCPKNLAEMYRILTVLISANSPCRYIANFLHQFSSSKLFIQVRSLVK